MKKKFGTKEMQIFFKDLEIDSLLALEILALIEKKFKVQIPEEKLVDITSLSATIDLTKSVLAESGKLSS